MMYFVDTNYFLRLVIDDKTEQTKIVYALFQEAEKGKHQLFSSTIVFFEIHWVLSSFYKKDRHTIILTLERILALPFIRFSERDILIKTIHLFSHTTLELEDCYNISYSEQSPSCTFATFDRKILSHLENS